MIKIFRDYAVSDILSREIDDYGEYEEVVKGILADVRARGDEALKEYGKKFDGAELDSLEVTEEEFAAAEGVLSEDYKRVVRTSAENIAAFHSRQVREGFEVRKDGVLLGQKYTPLSVAGVYVPVVAGVMPVTVAAQIKRLCAISSSALPQRFIRIVDRYGDNPAAMKQAGIAYATEQIIDLFANGINAVHVYSMNKPDVARAIKQNLSEILS